MTDPALAALLAENAIRRLVSAYCDAVARRDGEGAGRLYAPDARVKIADFPERVGREEITAGLVATFGNFAFLHQRADAGLIDVTDDRAHGRLTVFEMNQVPGAGEVGMIFGHYEDEYVRLEEGWRFAMRRFTLRQRVLVPVAKVQDLPDLAPLRAFAP